MNSEESRRGAHRPRLRRTMLGGCSRSFPLLLAGCLLGLGITPCAGWGQPSPASDERFDVLFLAADAPLWLSIRIEGAEQSLQSVRVRYAEAVIQSVDADGNGYADATEAPALPVRGRPGTSAERLKTDWKRFDTDPVDDRLSPQEYLAAVQTHLGPAFAIRRKPPVLLQSVQLLPRLDGNHDGRITPTEIARGAQTLTALDFDDDGTFSPAELQPFPQSMLDAAMAEQREDSLEPFVLVDARSDRAELNSLLYRRYADAQGIAREHAGLSGIAFEEADADGNDFLDATEAAVLLRPRPAVEIVVNLARGQVRIGRIHRGGDRVGELPVESPRRTALRLGSEAVEFSAHDNRYAAGDQIKLLKVRFLQGDTDKNGYMGEQEFVSLAGMEAGFADVDADSDGKVFIDELERFLRIQSGLAQCSLEMEFEAIEKPLFSVLDANLDRRLSAREFAFAAERLAPFDQDGDSILDTRELDLLNRFRVKFAFVVPPAVRDEQDRAMLSRQRMPLVGRTPRAGPQWFLNMDRNQDGEVTWREFLGPREAFEPLDADGSGWIDADEAASSGGGASN